MGRCFALIFGFMAALAAPAVAEVTFTDNERAAILTLGPWPPKWSADTSNRVSGSADAAAFGERLFSDLRLSKEGLLSCADCHQPARGFTDGTALSRGHGKIHRHTPSVVNLRFAHWFGWGGEADNLWAQSVRPILSKNEMALSAAAVRGLMISDAELSCRFKAIFKTAPSDLDRQSVLVNVGKALAAFQETLITGRTAFDRFRDALQKRDGAAMAEYPQSAQRGLKTFAGKGRCHLCHFGPLFTNGEFGDIGVPFFIGRGKIDKGRYGGIHVLKANPMNLLGRFSDDATAATPGGPGVRTRHVTVQHRNWGEFKVPSLRNVAKTAPYMHNGSIASLDDVIAFYSELNEDRLHTDGEKILRPLHLSASGKADLKTFLQSLSAPVERRKLPRSAPPAVCPEN